MTSVEQRYSIKFCFKLGKSAAETVTLLQQAYGDQALGKTQVYEWFHRFMEGMEDVEDNAKEGRPSEASGDNSDALVTQIVRNNPRLTVRKIGEMAGISKSSAHRILSDNLCMSRVCARSVPRLLTWLMKEHRVEVANEMVARYVKEGQAFLMRIVTGDECWLQYYDPLTKQQSSVWKTGEDPTPVKARVQKSAGKIMAVIFFDSEGILYRHIVPRGETVNGRAYIC